MDINSPSYFRSHWTIWKVLGVAYKQVAWRKLYIVYSLFVILSVTIGYPFHLGMSLFQNEDLPDDLKNLSIFVTCFSCSLKILVYAYNFDRVQEMEQLLKQLDSRVSGKEEIYIYSQLKVQLRNILFIFISIYLPLGVFAEMSFIFQKERALMYPAWFPFDWRNSTRNFYIANIYQIYGISFQLMQNYTSDCFPPVMLCIISAHIKMLYKRFENIGVADVEDAEAQRQLEDCITDHKCLIQLFKTMESFMSVPMFIQFAVTAVNVCISIAAFLFFAKDPIGRAYFILYAMAIPIQIFPTCYYATDLELWFGKLHYAAFSCNWTSQSRIFKRKLMLFVECSLKQITPMAGRMLRVHVDTFFSTIKFAYSLFTILLQMEK